MKILLCNRPGGAFGYITDGWYNALRSCGHEVRRWNGLETSWREYGPDLYIGCSGHKQPIPPHKDCKVAIHVNPYGPVNIEGINETQENIKWTLNQKPDAVFGYGHEEDRIIWSYWQTRHGIQWVPMPTAADMTQFKVITTAADRPYDLVYLGGRWKYKSQTIDSYLFPVLKIADLKSKVRGWGEWPPGICDGILPEDAAAIFLNNGRIGPCISEIHTHQYGIDIPERAFKVALCGTLVIHDPVPTLKRMIPSAVVSQNPQNFEDLCKHYTRPENDAERQELVNKQRMEVLNAHTYHHRMQTLLSALGFTEEAAGLVDGPSN